MAQNAEKLWKDEAERKDAEIAELRKESQDGKDSLEKEKADHNETKTKKGELEEIETYKEKITSLNRTKKFHLEDLTSKMKDLRKKQCESVKIYQARISQLTWQIENLQTGTHSKSQNLLKTQHRW